MKWIEEAAENVARQINGALADRGIGGDEIFQKRLAVEMQATIESHYAPIADREKRLVEAGPFCLTLT